MSVGLQDVQLLVNGQTLRTLRPGDVSPEGVKLTGIDKGLALLEVDGRALQLRIGQSTVTQTTLQANAQGHFITTALINGVAVRALIDTGATLVALNAADAQRMGINYAQGKRDTAMTANGPATVYLVTLAHVQVGDIAFSNVPGAVMADAAAEQGVTLIGMSFLRHVEMRQSGSTLTLLRADR